jgi:peroxiredoxin
VPARLRRRFEHAFVALVRHNHGVKTVLLLLLGLVGLASCESAPSVTQQRPDLSVFDAKNHSVNPFQDQQAKAIVFFFLRTDCPISNRYAPEIQRLAAKYAGEGIRFWLVYPEAATSTEEIERHREDYHLSLDPLRDPQHALVKMAQVTVTPEVAVFLPDGRELYRGRIDDRYVDFGKERPEATTHELEEALKSLLQGKPIVNSVTPAVGCYIE